MLKVARAIVDIYMTPDGEPDLTLTIELEDGSEGLVPLIPTLLQRVGEDAQRKLDGSEFSVYERDDDASAATPLYAAVCKQCGTSVLSLDTQPLEACFQHGVR